MRIFAIGENVSQISEFRDVFGMRYVGLVDSSGVYQTYRVPNPQAPYPQDYVIDQQGIVRYWSDQFDPQEVIRVIDRLLGGGGVAERWDWGERVGRRAQGATLVRGVLFLRRGHGTLLDIAGRPVRRLQPGRNDVSRLAPGVYFLLEQGTGQRPEPRIVVR